jgi:hypothetical protein
VLIAIAADMLLVEARRSFEPGFETTRITSPTLADGSIDYLTAVENHFSQGITNDNNAAPLMLEAFGRAALPSNQPPDGITARLGMPHLPEKGDYFISYTHYTTSATDEDDDLGDPNLPTHWPIKLRPSADKWVKDNEKPLALLTQASNRPHFFLPFNGGTRPESMLEILLPHANLLRQACKAFLVRAVLRLEHGDAAGFHDDVLTVLRLARVYGQAPTMIERIVANSSMEMSVCAVIRVAAQSGKLPVGEMRALLSQMIALGETPSLAVETINNGERLMVLDILQSMSRGGPRRAAELFVFAATNTRNSGAESLFRFVPVPYEASMRRLNAFYDGAISALNQPTYPEKSAALKLWNAEIQKIAQRNRILTFLGPDWPVMLFLPAITGPDNRWEIARMTNRLARIVLAISLYRADHGAYPQSLDSLSPDYLAKIPSDLFTEKPLIYSRTQDGYTLYSVGPNMTDDGGKSQGLSLLGALSRPEARRNADDIDASANVVAKQ